MAENDVPADVGEVAGNAEDVLSIVTTTRAKYFGRVNKTSKGIVIESAYEMQNENDAQAIARGFIKGALYGDNRRIELSDALVESVTDAPDETRVVKTYEALVPEARKRALGVMTYKALEDLLTK
jgi:hypothetical protein